MSDNWLPGFERWELPGVPGMPYDEPDDPKAVLHTTEGVSVDGAVQAYRPYPPQLIVDPVNERKVQHIPLNRAGYALWNEDADDSRCYQVEIVGYAAQSHLWPDEVLRWLGEELFRPLHEYGGVPYVAVWKGFRRDGEMPFVLAAASSPLRLTQAELDSFSGFLGHQHIPGDSHWDPGGLRVDKILKYAQATDNKEDDTMNLLVKGFDRADCYIVSTTADGRWKRRIDGPEFDFLKASGVQLHEHNQVDVDRIPDRSANAEAHWNYGVPTASGEKPAEFQPAHQVLAGINQNTAPRKDEVS